MLRLSEAIWPSFSMRLPTGDALRLPTASKLDLFRACKGPWYLPLGEQTYGKAAEKGRSLHKFAETGQSQSARGTKTAAEEGVERALADLPGYTAISGVSERELVVRYEPRRREAEIIGATTVARPYGDEDDKWIWGTADFVGRVDEALLVADLKTGSPAWLKMPWGPYGELEGAALQIPFLAAVLNAVLGFDSVILAVVSSQCERTFAATYSRSAISSVLDVVRSMVAEPPMALNPSELCTFCPVRGNCPLMAGL